NGQAGVDPVLRGLETLVGRGEGLESGHRANVGVNGETHIQFPSWSKPILRLGPDALTATTGHECRTQDHCRKADGRRGYASKKLKANSALTIVAGSLGQVGSRQEAGNQALKGNSLILCSKKG